MATPHIAAYLKYVRNILKNESGRLKDSYFRKRPYVQLAESTLIPEEEESHATTSSYPSSHATFGWGLALAMVELTPDSMNAVLQRGFEYGRSRVIAGYHWASDVQSARLVAAYTLVRLQRDTLFQALLDSARAEYALLRGHTSIAPRTPGNDPLLRQVDNTVTLTFTGQPIHGTLNLYSIDGRLMSTQTVNSNTSISLSRLPHGVYIVTFTGKDKFCSLKAVY